jgi:catechol 2,3-dioxygenase-like lactoylglutathione lyase family enzyme
MRVQALGHVVLKVRDLERSEIFYSDILGMRVVSRISDPPTVRVNPSETGFSIIN